LHHHEFPLRIYYEDTDFSGAVYHANYLKFFERARSEFLRELGVDQVALFEKKGLGFVVRTLTIDYVKPARMDDQLRVETTLARLGRASIELNQVLWRGDERICVGKLRLGLVALGLVGQGRPQPLPAEIYERLAGH
jgi:acyl-CoA thioester hydrolase